MNAKIELWDARMFDWEEDNYYALFPTIIDVGDVPTVVIQDYLGNITGHRIDAFAETGAGCREITLPDLKENTG